MTAIIEAALSHSRTVLLILVLLFISGTYAYVSIPKEADPDVNIPIIYVSMRLDGISPEDAERLLVKPMEQELSSIEGAKEMSSTAYQSGANVTLEFEAGFDSDQALTDVREAVDLAKPDLPAEADEPTVNEVNLSLFPVLTVQLSGDVPERTLLGIARDLQDRIETIPMVLEAEIVGNREERVELIIDPLKLESYGLDARAILQSVDASNRLVAAGELDTGEGRNAIKVPGLFETADDILSMPVKVDGDAVVTIADVAQLRSTFEDPTSFVRVNGSPGLAIEVSKRVGENIIETIEAVKYVVNETSQFWPEQVNVSFAQDKSTDIRTMLSDLQNNVTSAILLVMIVIVAAMGLRSAGLVGVAIPGSFLTGILVLYVMGFTVNIVVLFSLILAVGMLVDGAIVITEYADRKMTEGDGRHDAYAKAAKRMAWPIIAATSTTLAAFLPLMFWPGLVGEFMKFLPLTLIATLTASLFMALIFIPTLGSLVGKSGEAADPETMKAVAAGESGDLTKLKGGTGAYLRILNTALKAPGLVVLCAVMLLAGVLTLYAVAGRGVEFFPEVEPDNMVVWIHGRGNMSINERDALVREIETEILDMHRERGEFHAIYASSMTSSGQKNSDEPLDLIGKITLEFVDWDQRRSASEIIAEIEERSRPYAGIKVEVRKEEAGPPVGKPIQIEVGSAEPERIVPVVNQILGAMDEIGGFKDIEDGRPIPGIDWQITVNRSQAEKFGASVQLVGQYVQLVTRGLKVSTFRPDTSDDEVDFVVRVPERYRTLDFLDTMRVRTDAGLVPISNFVERHAEPSVSQLNRVDGLRVRTIKAEVGINPETGEPYLADDKVREIREWMDTANLDRRVEIAFKGEDEEQQEAAAFLSKAFLVALFLMAIILVTQFNSFYSAFLILSAVVMSTIGVMIGLLVTDQPFGIVMSGIGVIALAGIVVNNNIVLIDTFDRLKQDAGDAREAILRTGAQRLRPVLLTTITTILGLMPMVLSMNIDFIDRSVAIGAPSTQWWTQLATAIVFGLAFATLLTLIFTPCALMIRANFHDGKYRLFRRGGGAQDAGEPGQDETKRRPKLQPPWTAKPEAAE
jgi:multidrug efflux pump